MLTVYRRHLMDCEHRHEGRKYRRCRCPLWADGSLGGMEMRVSLHMKDWDKAQERIRTWEAEGTTTPQQPQAVTMEKACREFLADVESRELQESTLKKHKQLCRQLQVFAAQEGLLFIKQWDDVETVRRFRQSWRDHGLTVTKKLERLRAFFRFAVENGWLEKNPAAKLTNPVVKQKPTLPFTPEEMAAILAACASYSGNWRRILALVLLLRYSGLRIGDAARLPRDRIVDGKLFLYTQKTGVPVWCPLPPCVTDALNNFPPMNKTYFFWSGTSSKDGVATSYMDRLKKVFKRAGIPDGHAHRLRDTFATELLMAGVPMERVSVLLAHSSVKVTEKHYSPWVKARQEQLESDVRGTWERDPIVFAQTKGTPGVHEKMEAVN